jgi:hypothetical protein
MARMVVLGKMVRTVKTGKMAKTVGMVAMEETAIGDVEEMEATEEIPINMLDEPEIAPFAKQC